MRTYPEHYQPFLLDYTIDEYCKTKIDPYSVEIENLGLQVLIDALIKPAGINVEITYLDRSASDEGEANTFCWQGEATAYTVTPAIRLLYRP